MRFPARRPCSSRTSSIICSTTSDARIATFLAAWGYVLPHWLGQADQLLRQGVQVIDSARMAALFQRAQRRVSE